MLSLLTSLFLSATASAAPPETPGPLLTYARANYKATSELVVTRTESWSSGQPTPCEWSQTFEGGVTYVYTDYECDGSIVHKLNMPPVSLDKAKALAEALDAQMKEPGKRTWSSRGEHHSYDRPDQEAGCSMSLHLTKAALSLSYTCGC